MMQPALTKNIVKSIKQLEMRKFRRRDGLFIAEGTKLVSDNLGSMKCKHLIATAEWWQRHPEARDVAEEAFLVTEQELERVSLQPTPQEVLGTFYIPTPELDLEHLSKRLTIALDDIQDPGNLGTIIRLCDWFGISDIVCSPHTTDCYSPKVVQASMGAISRVKVHYTPLTEFLDEMSQRGVSICGTFLNGENLYTTPLPSTKAVIIMGNEGQGISSEVESKVSKRITIPSFAQAGEGGSESLNVSIATSIVVSEFCRRTL